MINIDSIRFGWLNLTIGDMTFCASYLTDVMSDIDYLLDLDEDNAKKIYLDGESVGAVNLVAYRDYDKLNIVWDYYDKKKIMTFSYKEFKEQWEKVKEDKKDIYNKEFDYNNWW